MLMTEWIYYVNEYNAPIAFLTWSGSKLSWAGRFLTLHSGPFTNFFEQSSEIQTELEVYKYNIAFDHSVCEMHELA